MLTQGYKTQMIFLVFAAFIALAGCVKSNQNSANETQTGSGGKVFPRKGVWLSLTGSSVMLSRENLKTAIQTLHTMGINTIYPVVWTKGLTTYNSKSLENLIGLPADPRLEGRSVLSETFAILKETGISMDVIPWFEYGLKVYLGLSEDQAKATLVGPSSALAPEFRFAHVMHKKGQLVRHPLEGQVIWFDPHMKAYYGFLDPSSTLVRGFVRGLVDEVTTHHPVSGIQFDDHFSVHKSFGPWLLRYFVSRAIVGFAKDIADTAKSNQVLVRQISPAGLHEFSKEHWMQDWQTFLRTDAFNELVLQAYREDLGDFQRLVSEPSTWQQAPRGARSVGIYAGTPSAPRSTDLLVSQIEVARNRQLGVNFFHYDPLVLKPSGQVDQERLGAIREALSKPWICHQDLLSFCGKP